MKQTQPNFEKLKTIFYQSYVETETVDIYIAMESLCGHLLPSFYKRKENFKKEFNQWLDRIDIRQSGALIDALKSDKKNLPKWMKDKKYIIDYNKNEMLDLIKT